MLIKTVWIKRKGCEDDPAELLVAIDQPTLDIHGEHYLQEAAEEEKQSWGNPKIAQEVVIDISIPQGKIEEAFQSHTVQGTVHTQS